MENPKKHFILRMLAIVASVLLIFVLSLRIAERVGYSIGLRLCTCEIEKVYRY